MSQIQRNDDFIALCGSDSRGGGSRKRAALAYNSGFDFTIEDQNIMEAERINIISALLNDLTVREAELRRYL